MWALAARAWSSLWQRAAPPALAMADDAPATHAAPRFTVNLDEPPRQRWASVARAYRAQWSGVVARMWELFRQGEESGDAKEEEDFAEGLCAATLAGLSEHGRRDWV